MAASLATIQYDRPLRDRAADQLRSDARHAALRSATGSELVELATRLSYAGAIRGNGDKFAERIAAGPLKPVHLNGLASLRHLAEDADVEVAAWWSERCPEPTRAIVESVRHRWLAAGLLAVPDSLPIAEVPCDGLPTPEGYCFLGDTRGTKLPDGSRGLPIAVFFHEADETVWVRSRRGPKAGELVGYSGVPLAEVLGTRGD